MPGEEAALLFRKMLASVRKMSQRGIFFLMSQSFSKLNKNRSFLLRELAGFAHAVLKLKSEAETLQVVLDKPPHDPPQAVGNFRGIQEIDVGAHGCASANKQGA